LPIGSPYLILYKYHNFSLVVRYFNHIFCAIQEMAYKVFTAKLHECFGEIMVAKYFYLEVKNVFDTAFEEGEKVGIEKGIEKVAKALKEKNIAIEIIAESTGLSYEVISRI